MTAIQNAGHQHSIYPDLFLWVELLGHKIYANAAKTSGVVETPPRVGWVDHWIRYATVGNGSRLGFDAPQKINPTVIQFMTDHFAIYP